MKAIHSWPIKSPSRESVYGYFCNSTIKRGNINNRFRKPKLKIKDERVDAADDRGGEYIL